MAKHGVSLKLTRSNQKGAMKKTLFGIIGAAMLMVVGLFKAQAVEQVYPVSVWTGVAPTSITATVKTDGNLMSLEIKDLQEGAFVMEVFMRSTGVVTCTSIVSDDHVDLPDITSGVFHTSDGVWDKKAVFTIANKTAGRYSNGIVTFASTVPWNPNLGDHVMLIKVNATGPTGSDSCWLVAIKPPTATEVTNFAVSVSSATNRVVIRKLIGGKLTPVSTNITVTTTASYQIGIGNSDDVAVGVQGERWNATTGQYELFPVGPLWTVSVGMTVGGSAVVPNDQDGKYLLVAYAADGTAEVVAVFNCNAPPPPNTN